MLRKPQISKSDAERWEVFEHALAVAGAQHFDTGDEIYAGRVYSNFVHMLKGQEPIYYEPIGYKDKDTYRKLTPDDVLQSILPTNLPDVLGKETAVMLYRLVQGDSVDEAVKYAHENGSADLSRSRHLRGEIKQSLEYFVHPTANDTKKIREALTSDDFKNAKEQLWELQAARQTGASIA